LRGALSTAARISIVTKKIYASYEKHFVGKEEAKITEIKKTAVAAKIAALQGELDAL